MGLVFRVPKQEGRLRLVARTAAMRIGTGHYKIWSTLHEVKEVAPGEWELTDRHGEVLDVYPSKAAAIKDSPRQADLQRTGEHQELPEPEPVPVMPPSQPTNHAELAYILSAVREPAPGCHYVVLEVPDQLTQ